MISVSQRSILFVTRQLAFRYQRKIKGVQPSAAPHNLSPLWPHELWRGLLIKGRSAICFDETNTRNLFKSGTWRTNAKLQNNDPRRKEIAIQMEHQTNEQTFVKLLLCFDFTHYYYYYYSIN
jgi:hypothetical protein